MTSYDLSSYQEPETIRSPVLNGNPTPLKFAYIGEDLSSDLNKTCFLKSSKKDKDYGFDLTSYKKSKNHLIENVRLGSASYEAGFRKGDTIIEIDNVPVKDMDHLQIVKHIKTRLENKSGISFILREENTTN